MTLGLGECEDLALWALVSNGTVAEILETNIQASWFTDDARPRFDWVMQFVTDHGKLPDSSTYGDAWRLRRPEVIEPFGFYATEMRLWNQTLIMNEVLGQVQDALFGQRVDEATQLMSGAAEKLQTDFGAMSDLHMSTIDLHSVYDQRRREGRRQGLPTGFGAIDRTVNGLQDGQLITLVGPPKAGKTFTLAAITSSLWQAGADVLFVTFEMSQTQIRDRLVAIMAGVNYSRLQAGTCTPEEMDTLAGFEWAGEIVITATDDATVSAVAAKLVQHHPKVLVVDGAYFMADDNGNSVRYSPQALATITRSFKRLAMKANIPVLISTQVLPSRYSSAKGIALDSIGFTSGFGMDSDLVLGVDTPDPINYPERKRLAVVAARDAPVITTHIVWDWLDTSWEEESEYIEETTRRGQRGEAAGSILDGLRRPSAAG